MSKLFDVDFRKGTAIERINKVKPTLTSGPQIVPHDKGKCMLAPSGLQAFNYTDNLNIGTSDFSIDFAFRSIGRPAVPQYIYNKITATTGLRIYVNDPLYRLRLAIGDTAISYLDLATADLSDGKWHHVCIIADRDALATTYIDGVLAGTANISGRQGSINAAVISVLGSSGFGLVGNVLYFKIYDHLLSTKEIRSSYYSYLSSANIEVNQYALYYPKPTSLNKAGLVAAYNMIPINGILTDISGNGNHLTAYGTPSQTAEGIYFNGSSYFERLGNSNLSLNGTDDFIIHIRFKMSNISATSLALISGSDLGAYAAKYFFIRQLNTSQFVLEFEGNSGNQLRIIYSADYTDGVWRTLTVTHKYNGSTSTLTSYIDGVQTGTVTAVAVGEYTNGDLGLGSYVNSSSEIFQGEIAEVQIYKRAFTTKDVYEYNNKWASQVLLSENFQNNIADAVSRIPYGWSKGTGSFCIDEDVDGYRYMKCLSSGYIGIQSDVAYGTWEFDFYKANASGNSAISIISTGLGGWGINGNGYAFLVGSNENIAIRKFSNGVDAGALMDTAASYIVINTLYRIRITRTTSGVIKLEIRGGIFGSNYTLVNVIGGSGANPATDNTYTSSIYFSKDVDTNDRLGKILITKGVII